MNNNMPKSDYLLDAAHRSWDDILAAYQIWADKKPVMLLDIQKQHIYAYPYAEFRNDLNDKSQRCLEAQYETAVRDNKMVIFVRDNERKRFISFLMPIE